MLHITVSIYFTVHVYHNNYVHIFPEQGTTTMYYLIYVTNSYPEGWVFILMHKRRFMFIMNTAQVTLKSPAVAMETHIRLMPDDSFITMAPIWLSRRVYQHGMIYVEARNRSSNN